MGSNCMLQSFPNSFKFKTFFFFFQDEDREEIESINELKCENAKIRRKQLGSKANGNLGTATTTNANILNKHKNL